MASSGLRPRSVEVSVEKLLEHEIEEISHNGDEKYRKPFSLAEELTHFTHKIDFLEGEGEDDLENGNNEEDLVSDNKQDQTKREQQWPWESVRNKLRNALSEVCILLDVLQVMKEKKYLVLEPVTQSPEPPKQVVQMIGKRKSLAKAAEIICNGAERMKQRDSEEKGSFPSQSQPSKQDYYTELMKLRQKWKVKKIGNMITGDLSYKSAGSAFWHRGLFEVMKTEDLPEDERNNSVCPLTVRVSSDLEGYSRIHVKITDFTEIDKMDVDDTLQCSNDVQAQYSNGHAGSRDMSCASPWQKKLKQAQYNLYCKELFSQISREAFHSKNLNSVQVSGKTIRLQLYPTAFAEITYEKASKDEGFSYEALLSGHGDVMEYRLQKLLHEQYLSRVDTPTPRPANAPWTTRDHTIGNLKDFFAKKNVTFIPRVPLLLDEFYDELKHSVLRKRTGNLLDQMATEHTDPSIAAEWSANAGPKTSFANIHMFSKRQMLCYRTSFHLKVELDKFEVVDMTGKTVSMSGVLEDLQDYVKMQVCLHFANVALGIFEDFDWKILQHPNDVGINMQGQSYQLKARSSSHECSLALSVSPDYSFHISVQKALAADEDPNLTNILDARWTRVEGKTTSVDWKSLHGLTFADKFYGLVASLS